MLFYGALKPFIELSTFEIFAPHLQYLRVICRHFNHQEFAQTEQFKDVMKNHGFQFALLSLNLITFQIILI